MGLHYGISKNNVVGNHDVKTFGLDGEQWALQYEYRNEERLGYAIAAAYESKGFFTRVIVTNEEGDPTGEVIDLENTFTYFSLPIKTGFFIGKKLSAFGYAGASPSILLNAYKDNVNGSGFDREEVSDLPNRFDFSLLLEVGGSYQLLRHFGVMTSVQFDQSLLTLSNRNYHKDWKLRHSRVVFHFGLTYKLKGKKAQKPFLLY